MTGTLINTAAVIAGGCIGLGVKKGLPEKIDHAVTQMLGLATCVIGMNGLLSTMLTADPATGAIRRMTAPKYPYDYISRADAWLETKRAALPFWQGLPREERK